MKSVVACMMGFLIGAPLMAQQRGAVPAGFRVRPDDPAAAVSTMEFVDMSPGWHITTGPAVILFHPDSMATGQYRLTSESFLFDPGSRNEAYGVIIGGRDLTSDDQSYIYFVIRRSGDFLIRQRTGAKTSDVRAWTPSPAIVKYDASGEAHTAKNVLSVDAGQEMVAFSINGEEVARVPRASVDVDGIIGLRVNHAINLHVSSLKIEKR